MTAASWCILVTAVVDVLIMFFAGVKPVWEADNQDAKGLAAFEGMLAGVFVIALDIVVLIGYWLWVWMFRS